MAKVLAALSGGVDSSVAAALLLEQGYDVVGCIGIMHGNALESPDTHAAQDVAQRLGIPFHVLDLRKPFEEHVISPFCLQYCHGLTPSPCIECNKHVKFGALQDAMRSTGCDFMATGHYARIVKHRGSFELHKAFDTAKDQSYMLARLNQDQLARTLFPLGCLSKDEVRMRARALGFENAERPESQDICFIPDDDYASFIENRLVAEQLQSGDSGLSATAHTSVATNNYHANAQHPVFPPGPFVSPNGEVLGQHRGIVHYTIGQRKGIGLAFGEPRYVCSIDAESNTITIGTADDLLTHDVFVRDFSWIAGSAPSHAFRCTAKIRYRQSEQEVAVSLHQVDDASRADDANQNNESGRSIQADQSSVHLHFDEAQRAVTPGQFAVLYDGGRVLGAGTIARK